MNDSEITPDAIFDVFADDGLAGMLELLAAQAEGSPINEADNFNSF